jgi:hypothetical protein
MGSVRTKVVPTAEDGAQCRSDGVNRVETALGISNFDLISLVSSSKYRQTRVWRANNF